MSNNIARWLLSKKQLTGKKTPCTQRDRLRQTDRQAGIIPQHILLCTLCTLWHNSGNNNDDNNNDNNNNNNNNNNKTDRI